MGPTQTEVRDVWRHDGHAHPQASEDVAATATPAGAEPAAAVRAGRASRIDRRAEVARAVIATLRRAISDPDALEIVVAAAGEEVARTWRLYMSAARFGFERGDLDVCQLLLARPVARRPAAIPLRPWW